MDNASPDYQNDRDTFRNVMSNQAADNIFQIFTNLSQINVHLKKFRVCYCISLTETRLEVFCGNKKRTKTSTPKKHLEKR